MLLMVASVFGGNAFALTATPTDTPTSTPTFTPTPTNTATSTPTPTTTATPPATPTPPKAFEQSFQSGIAVKGYVYSTGSGVVIGPAGTAISHSVRGTITIDIGNVTAATCLDTSIRITGTQLGDECLVGLPAAPQANVMFSCYVPAVNFVTIHVCNPTAGDLNPGSATYNIRTLN